MDNLIKQLTIFSPFGKLDGDGSSKFYDVFRSNVPEVSTINELVKFARFFREELLKQPLLTSQSPGSSATQVCADYFRGAIYDKFHAEENLPALKPLFDELIETIIKVYEMDCSTSGNYQSLRTILSVNNFEKYAENELTAAHVKRLTAALKRDFEPKDETKLRNWPSDMPYPAGELLNMFSFEAIEQSKKELIELFIFWAETALKYSSKNEAHNHKMSLFHKIISIFESPLKNIQRNKSINLLFIDLDVEVYEYTFSKCYDILMSPNYENNRYVNDIMRYLIMEHLATALKDNTNNAILAKTYEFTYKLFKNDKKAVIKDIFNSLNEKFFSIDFEKVGLQNHFDRFTNELISIKTKDEASLIVKMRKTHYEEKFFSILQEDVEKLKYFLKIIVENPWRDVHSAFFLEHLEKKKLVSFKKNPEIFSHIYDIAYDAKLNYEEAINDCFWRIGLKVYEAMDKQNCLAKLKKDIFTAIEKSFDFSKHPLHEGVYRFSYALDWKNEIKRFHSILRKLLVTIEKKEDISDPSDKICRVTQSIFDRIGCGVGKSKKILELKDTLADLFNACYDSPWSIDDDDPRIVNKICIGDDNKRTLAGQILKSSLKTIYQQNNDFSELLFPVIENIKKLKNQDDDDELHKLADSLIKNLTDQMELLGDEGGREIIDEFIEERTPQLLGKILEMYPNCSDYIHEKLPDIQEIAEEEDQTSIAYFSQLIAKKKKVPTATLR